MAALRTWSAPSTRARLIAAAWTAGETNVRLLSEAARCARQTVYNDLRSVGIDPNNRPKDTTMITIAPLDIEGFTGSDEHADDEFGAAMDRWVDEHPNPSEEEVKAERWRLLTLMLITQGYADARDRLAQEQVARFERDRALHQVELRWEALSTAPAWLAAHHAYVLAVEDARIAIDMWRERAATAAARPFACTNDGHQAAYRQIQAAGHSSLEDATAALDPDPAGSAARLRADLDQAHERHEQLAAQTRTHTHSS
ncbi:hypothetical protein ACWEV4_29660 [Streptomyces sp. NPDC003860]